MDNIFVRPCELIEYYKRFQEDLQFVKQKKAVKRKTNKFYDKLGKELEVYGLKL